MNICKIYLHEEKFSLKTQLETDRKTFIQLDCKGRSTWIWVGRLFRQSGYSGIPLGEDIVEEGDYTSTEISLGSDSSHILGTPAWDSMTGSCVPFVWFEN